MNKEFKIKDKVRLHYWSEDSPPAIIKHFDGSLCLIKRRNEEIICDPEELCHAEDEKINSLAAENIAAELDKVDEHKKICEKEIFAALGKFITSTGLRPTYISINTEQVTKMGSKLHEYIVTNVELDYYEDSRV